METNKSEVAALLAKIEREYQSCQQGLTGLAEGTARHDFIARRTEGISLCHEQLVELVGPDQAIALVANAMWTPGDQGMAQKL